MSIITFVIQIDLIVGEKLIIKIAIILLKKIRFCLYRRDAGYVCNPECTSAILQLFMSQRMYLNALLKVIEITIVTQNCDFVQCSFLDYIKCHFDQMNVKKTRIIN